MNFALIEKALAFVAKHPEHVVTITAIAKLLTEDKTLGPDLAELAQAAMAA